MQSSNSFEISPPTNSLQFHMNIQSFDAQGNESIEKAINLLALHMMIGQTHPALIFSRTVAGKNLIMTPKTISSTLQQKNARCSRLTMRSLSVFCFLEIFSVFDTYAAMSMGVTIQGVELKPFLPRNITSSVQVPTWDKMLEPKVPRDWPHPGHKRAISYHDNREQFYPLPCKLMS